MEAVEGIRKNYNPNLSIKDNLRLLDEKKIYYDIDSILLYIAVDELKDLDD
ncbi:MAG: hypothetical protein K2M17_03245 [Bacilli bacterium]|nr:hypothetical protein [Bacilli bacterium]